MYLVENVYDIANSFMKNPTHVKINYQKINELASSIKLSEIAIFPIPNIQDNVFGVLIELIASSINYCYWYGTSSIRPGDASSGKMYEILLGIFKDIKYLSDTTMDTIIDKYCKELILNRFPLIEERIKHLNELKQNAISFSFSVKNFHKEEHDFEFLFQQLITLFPGFGSDILLKRASLFFIQLYRKYGWFEEEMKNIFVPADYQIPKMLRYYKCLDYNDELQSIIDNNVLIPKNSLIECEIRSATILTIQRLCKLTGWNTPDIDSFLFLNRHSCKDNFHLTITTDY